MHSPPQNRDTNSGSHTSVTPAPAPRYFLLLKNGPRAGSAELAARHAARAATDAVGPLAVARRPVRLIAPRFRPEVG